MNRPTMKPLTFLFILPIIALASCRDREAEQRQKEIKAAEAFDKQHDEAMKDATKGNFPKPKPAGPIPE